MSTNLDTPIATSRSLSGEGWAAIAGAAGSAVLLAKKLLAPKPAKPELMSRADFYAEMVDLRERLHANHLDLLAAIERQGSRISALEAGFARLDERTRK